MQRREAVGAILTGLMSPFLGRPGKAVCDAIQPPDFAEIERQVGGRVGVTALDVTTRRRLTYRANERFPMCSTFKLLLAAQVLSRIDAGREQLTRVILYSQADLLEYAPITRARISDGGMTVSDLMAAALQYSDNTAANLLLRVVGGPSSFTDWVRSIGDADTRLDRTEPDLNSAVPGDPRDTTTPNAMAVDMEVLLVGNGLAGPSRALLRNWLVGNTTGGGKLRAGLPAGWRVGDKTGSGAHGTTNDVAIIWPPTQRPLIVAAYVTHTTSSAAVRNEALAAIGGAAAVWARNSQDR